MRYCWVLGQSVHVMTCLWVARQQEDGIEDRQMQDNLREAGNCGEFFGKVDDGGARN
jgi:hypothetical protein